MALEYSGNASFVLPENVSHGKPVAYAETVSDATHCLSTCSYIYVALQSHAAAKFNRREFRIRNLVLKRVRKIQSARLQRRAQRTANRETTNKGRKEPHTDLTQTRQKKQSHYAVVVTANSDDATTSAAESPSSSDAEILSTKCCRELRDA